MRFVSSKRRVRSWKAVLVAGAVAALASARAWGQPGPTPGPGEARPGGAAAAPAAPARGTSKLVPRPLSAAEREAVRLVASYLASGPEALWTALAPDAPLRALGHEAALDEIRVRLGPAAGAAWAMRTPGPRHGSTTAIFTVEYPSGLEETVSLELTAGERPALRAVKCLVDPAVSSAVFPAAPAALAGETARALPLGVAPAPRAVAGVGLALLALAAAAFGPSRRRRRVVPLTLVTVLLGAAPFLGCGRKAASTKAAAPAPPPLLRLGSLWPLRQALAAGSATDREELFAHATTAAPLGDVVRLWHAEELTLRGQLNQAAAVLAEVKSKDVPLAALLRARLGFLRADAKATSTAFDEASALGPDHDALRIEAAEAASLLGTEGELEIALRQAGEMGSRDATVFYTLAEIALGDDLEDDAEWLFGRAWRLQPLEREILLGRPGLAALCARPSLFGTLGLNAAAEPLVRAEDLGSAAVAWPAGAVQRLTGARLGVAVGGATLDVPAGAPLASAAAVLEAPAARRRREEDEALARLPLLQEEAAAGAWGRAALRHDVELASYALAHRERWQDLVRLTDTADRALDQVGSEIVQMRALALKQSDRNGEAKDLLVRLAKSDIANRRRDPSPFFQLAELMAGQDEIDLAVRLYRRALSLSPVRSGSARLRQLEMQKRLIAEAHTMQTAHFVLRYPDVTGEKYAGQLSGVLEQEWQRLQKWIPLRKPGKVKVDLFPAVEFLRDYSAGVPVLGIFDGHVRVPLADLHSLRPLLVSILSHELAHALITERTHDRAPKWVQEGLAQHIQMSDQPVNPFPDLVRVNRQLALPVVEAALGGFSDEQFVDVAYGQAVWTVHFVESKWGLAGLHRLLDAYDAGKTNEDALRAAFGVDYAGFDEALWRWAASAAPAWPTTLRRYDEETERAELVRDTSDRRFAIAPQAARPSLGESLAQSMQRWHARYAASVRGIKANLGPVIAVYRGGAKQDLTAPCRSLSADLVGLLQDPTILAAPDAAVASSLRRGYQSFQHLATACERGDSASVVTALTDAERALGEAARALQPWNLRP